MQLTQNSLLQNGKYRIEKVLGQGGFGITYLGEQVALGRKVAIKEFFMKEYCNRNTATSHVSVGSQGSKDTVDRFRLKFIKEAQLIAGLNHPNIIRIHDIFEENGTAYYVMEYQEGGSLSEYLKMRGVLGEEEALYFIRQIAGALEYIHEKKINHLDVKPGNILLNETNDAVLIDFGLSKRYDDEGNQTSTTPVGISHGYAPLEQYKRGGVGIFSPATDIYSLGATLYKLLTGNTPPEANDVMEDGLPAMPSNISGKIRNAIVSAMTPARSKRPQSIDEFLQMLGEAEGKKNQKSKAKKTEKKPNVEDEETSFTDTVSDKKKKQEIKDGDSQELPAYKRRHWIVNLGYICYMLWIVFWSFVLPWFVRGDDDEIFGAISILCATFCLDSLIRMWRNQRNAWYLLFGTLAMCALGFYYDVNANDDLFIAGMILLFTYAGFFVFLLIFKKNGKSAFKLLEESEPVSIFSELAVLKQRHWVVNVTTGVIIFGAVFCSMLFTYQLWPAVIGLLYSLYLGLRNCKESTIIAMIFIFGGLFVDIVNGNMECNYPLWILVILCYILQFAVLFIRKNGKSALSLMR
ncbi:MAG: serine/threonine protein kinase [Bacteroidales bacterium]|nr:serine/threonine protein kinase [Bacteroidales bacterium]